MSLNSRKPSIRFGIFEDDFTSGELRRQGVKIKGLGPKGTMSNRREFLAKGSQVAAGVVFTNCGLVHASPQATASTSRRRQVVVSGKRVRTIDVHGHCVVPEAMALIGSPLPGLPTLLMNPATVGTRLQWMDKQGIDTQVLSVNAYWYQVRRDVAERLIRIQNETLSQICAQNPERLIALASVALQFPELAAAQLEEGVKALGLRGVSIGGSVNGEELSARKFEPFWAKAEELGALVFLHPQPQPDPLHRLQGNGALGNVIGNPLETTITLSHLIFDGTLDRFPGVKLCLAHGGGYLPSYADRSDHGCTVFPQQCGNPVLKKHPTEYLRQLYFDSLVFTSVALQHLVAVTGPGQIVMGTDYPYPWTSNSVDHILLTPGLADSDRRRILGETAAELLKLGRE
jgi:aminocarboxymuconate-semialdehyde decarboxylase